MRELQGAGVQGFRVLCVGFVYGVLILNPKPGTLNPKP